MTNFLEKMSPDDQMAVAYVGRSDLGQDFTNDVGRWAHATNNGEAHADRDRAARQRFGAKPRADAVGEMMERRFKIELDQCRDLLRQRDARREFGLDPNDAKARPASIVERYKQ